MPAPPKIADLVERFAEHAEAYKSGQYDEAQLRQEFIAEIKIVEAAAT
jgi:hypothetical protein